MTTSQSGERRRPSRALTQRLEDLARAGVTHVGKPRRPSSSKAPLPPAEAAQPPLVELPSSDRAPLEQRKIALEVIREQVAVCTLCRELADTRTQTVFGVGNPLAKLCFVGEAPGADEDLKGEPFVGRAGQLLTKIIEACGMRREDVYILNVLKCRPPANRTPLPHEVFNCRPYLDRQLAIIQPEYICCLGSVAAQTLLETDVSIGRLRGKFQEYRGIPVLCTYHPAYLLRNPAAKKDTWEDMKRLLAAMGLKPPGS